VKGNKNTYQTVVGVVQSDNSGNSGEKNYYLLRAPTLIGTSEETYNNMMPRAAHRAQSPVRRRMSIWTHLTFRPIDTSDFSGVVLTPSSTPGSPSKTSARHLQMAAMSREPHGKSEQIRHVLTELLIDFVSCQK